MLMNLQFCSSQLVVTLLPKQNNWLYKLSPSFFPCTTFSFKICATSSAWATAAAVFGESGERVAFSWNAWRASTRAAWRRRASPNIKDLLDMKCLRTVKRTDRQRQFESIEGDVCRLVTPFWTSTNTEIRACHFNCLYSEYHKLHVPNILLAKWAEWIL